MLSDEALAISCSTHLDLQLNWQVWAWQSARQGISAVSENMFATTQSLHRHSMGEARGGTHRVEVGLDECSWQKVPAGVDQHAPERKSGPIYDRLLPHGQIQLDQLAERLEPAKGTKARAGV